MNEITPDTRIPLTGILVLHRSPEHAANMIDLGMNVRCDEINVNVTDVDTLTRNVSIHVEDVSECENILNAWLAKYGKTIIFIDDGKPMPSLTLSENITVYAVRQASLDFPAAVFQQNCLDMNRFNFTSVDLEK